MHKSFYDPKKSFDENVDHGPFGAFADGKIFEQKGEPQYEFLGFKVYSPFGIAAGPLPTSPFIKAAFDKGFDVCVYKTQRSTVFPCNPFPNILFVDVEGDLTIEKSKKPLLGQATTNKKLSQVSITNSFGNPSRGPEFWQEDMGKAVSYQGKGQLLIASIVGTIKEGFSEEDYYDDFALAASLAYKTGVKVVELNLACPNVATEGVVCYTKEAVFQICKKSKEKSPNALFIVKLGYYTDRQQQLLEEIIKEIDQYINAVSVINTIPAAVVDEYGKQALPGEGRLRSGICGASIKWAGLDMVKRLVRLREKLSSEFEIIGVGGVMTSEDYFEYKKAGADVVQSATAVMWNPYLAQEIKAVL